METINQKMTEEQAEVLKEKIKNMSPEELKEFQKKQCIFCQIVSGKVQAKKIYEDERCIAMLDINPANPGHIILMPKEHYMVMPQLPKDDLEHIFIVAKSLSNTVLKSLNVKGTNIIAANGLAAGQRAQHFMVHIIPRKEKDGIVFSLPQRKISEKELDAIQEKLSKKLGLKEAQKIEIKKAPKKEIVEAEFKENKETPKRETRKSKKETGMDERKDKKPKKGVLDKGKTKKEEQGVDLDAIADMFGKNEQ